MNSKALMALSEADMDKRIALARFPQELTAKDRQMLGMVARTYGLDPMMGELMIYQGRPFVSIDGRYRLANETGDVDGIETRPATSEERQAWGMPEGDYFCRAELHKKGSTFPFIGWGRVRETETTKKGSEYLPLGVNPQRMAEKRAEAQALRKAFYLPLPGWEEATPDSATEVDGEVVGEVGQNPALQNGAPSQPTIADAHLGVGTGPGGVFTWEDFREEMSFRQIPVEKRREVLGVEGPKEAEVKGLTPWAARLKVLKAMGIAIEPQAEKLF